MRWTAAFVVSVALVAHASAGADATQTCRDAWANWNKRVEECARASDAIDETRFRAAEAQLLDATEGVETAFAAAPWESFDELQDRDLLDFAFGVFVRSARGRDDIAAARRGAAAFAAKCCTEEAFEARTLWLADLDLAAGDVDQALIGFRLGAWWPNTRLYGPYAVLLRTRVRAVTARMRVGDVLAACGDIEGARTEYAAARKLVGDPDPSDGIAQAILGPAVEQLRARTLVGMPVPALPKCAWLGGAPADAQHRVMVLFAGRIGREGDSGRLRELDRLSSEIAGGGIDVRIVVAPGQMGFPRPRRGGFAVWIPRGPDDPHGVETGFDGTDAVGAVAKIRERLQLRSPVAVAEARLPLQAPLDGTPLVLIADRSGTIVHASVSGDLTDFTDWVCGLARVVAGGRKPAAPPAKPDGAELVLACSRNLAALAGGFTESRKTTPPHGSGPGIWFDLGRRSSPTHEIDARRLVCSADPGALIPTLHADAYVWEAAGDLYERPPEVCSYVGRDLDRFPVGKDEKDAVLGACLHHPGGALVARADGTVEFVTLKDLGIASDAEKTVGPDSKAPLLRVLR